MMNPNVNVDTSHPSFDKYTPADGYELWRDNEEGNLDENGQPLSYMKTMYVPKAASEDFTSHIQAHKIGDTMTETEMKAQAYDILTGGIE